MTTQNTQSNQAKLIDENSQVLANVALVNMNVSVWSGQAKLDPSDIRLGDGGKLPDSKVAQIGTKNICNPSLIKKFNTVRESIRNTITEHGIPFMGGYAVPVSVVSEMTPVLDEMIEKFNAMKADFIASYDDSVDAWIDENPDFADEIRNSVLSREDAAARFSASYKVYQLAPVAGSEASMLGTNDEVGDSLIDDIQKVARKFYEKYGLNSVTKADPRSVARWEYMRKKVAGLTFLGDKFDDLHDLIKASIALYEDSAGSVTGTNLAKLKHNALILGTDEIHRYLGGNANDTTSDDAPAEDAQAENEGDSTTTSDAQSDDATDATSKSHGDDEAAEATADTPEANEAKDDDFDAMFGDLDDMLSSNDDQDAEQDVPAADVAAAENEVVVKSVDWGAW